MLWMRSASLTMMTRISSTMASSILRTLSALPVLGGEEIQLGQLGDAVHAACHFLAELLAHLLHGDAGILHHVVQQAGLYGDAIHPHLRQNAGDADGVRHVRLPRVAHLPFMPLPREAEGLFQRREIVLGPVFANL